MRERQLRRTGACDHFFEPEQTAQQGAEVDGRKDFLNELHYFGGMMFRERADMPELSSGALDPELRFASARLKTIRVSADRMGKKPAISCCAGQSDR